MSLVNASPKAAVVRRCSRPARPLPVLPPGHTYTQHDKAHTRAKACNAPSSSSCSSLAATRPSMERPERPGEEPVGSLAEVEGPAGRGPEAETAAAAAATPAPAPAPVPAFPPAPPAVGHPTGEGSPALPQRASSYAHGDSASGTGLMAPGDLDRRRAARSSRSPRRRGPSMPQPGAGAPAAVVEGLPSRGVTVPTKFSRACSAPGSLSQAPGSGTRAAQGHTRAHTHAHEQCRGYGTCPRKKKRQLDTRGGPGGTPSESKVPGELGGRLGIRGWESGRGGRPAARYYHTPAPTM